MKQGNVLPDWIGGRSIIGVFLLASSVCGWTQTSSGPAPPGESAALTSAVHDLQQQVDELRAAVVEIRHEAAQYRAETAALRRELETVRGQSGGVEAAPRAGSYAAAAQSDTATPAEAAPPTARQESLAQRVASLEETSQLLNSKIDDQYQTKVESASKYRVRLSGIVLMNLFSNRGQTDNTDFPSFAIGPNQDNGNFGATLRQSEIGLEVFGPTIAGARTSGNLQADFAGGFVDTWNGASAGVFRLRIASMRMDWRRTSLLVGQDELFVSPLSPTSFASLAVPSLSYAGNLWSWTPQVRVEHRFDLADDQNITVQGGIFDNLTGEFPASSYFRSAGPGERSGQPAYGFRTAWTRRLFGRPLTLGGAGYYGRQVWAFDHYTDGWAGMADWDIPIVSRLSLSGEFYRGRAVGGIGGGVSRSVLFGGDPTSPATAVRGLNSIGGWSQFKFKANSKLEFNAAFGLDNPTSSEVRAAAASEQYVGPLRVQNRGGLVNFVYRPRSNLLFSTEYRHLQTFQLYGIDNTAEQVNMMMGILF
ncbi:MAG: hypothetical protein LAO09_07360 [Acidobacteriia bacterium]|nr:hypothetical protein [Terriglobia bacterium]